ncbi:hypothetical protein ABT063_46680 [Streptomyces sp. NPDC002838]|uniref:hypothetical protein n=1 Tax=Streptomyces sp. NPDC002838 TaxID=3154436 RepID=UPI00331FD0E2
MAAQRALEEAKVEAFMEKALGDLSGTMTTGLCHLGDRLGLFKDLAANRPSGSQELAARLPLNERCAREWLRGFTAAGYPEEPEPGCFPPPAEHAPALADESSHSRCSAVPGRSRKPAVPGQRSTVLPIDTHNACAWRINSDPFDDLPLTLTLVIKVRGKR